MAQYADTTSHPDCFSLGLCHEDDVRRDGEKERLPTFNLLASLRANHGHPDGFPFPAKPAFSSHWIHYPV